jgi:hypothetical protein
MLSIPVLRGGESRSYRCVTDSRQLPPSLAGRQLSARLVSPLYSLASEQVAAIEETILLTTSSRRMQLATASLSLPDSGSPPKAMLGWHRDAVVAAARRLVASVVQLGSEKLLQHCDISESAFPLIWSHANRNQCLSIVFLWLGACSLRACYLLERIMPLSRRRRSSRPSGRRQCCSTTWWR